MFTVKRVHLFNVIKLLKVTDILYKCGKDMAKKYDLHHWDNSVLKNLIIVFLCVLRNKIFLVYKDKSVVATFQTRKKGAIFLFQKLATLPEVSGTGIGSFCLKTIEDTAKQQKCKQVECEVYEKSEHAKVFYKNKGYKEFAVVETLKYKEIKLKKEL